MPLWQLVKEEKVAPFDLRKNYVNVHGIVLQALGVAGQTLLDQYPDNWKERLNDLKKSIGLARTKHSGKDALCIQAESLPQIGT